MSCSELVCTVIKNFFGGFEHEGICLTWYAPLRPTVGVLPMSAKSLVLKSRTSLDWTKNVSMDEEWCSTKGIKWKENHSRLNDWTWIIEAWQFESDGVIGTNTRLYFWHLDYRLFTKKNIFIFLLIVRGLEKYICSWMAYWFNSCIKDIRTYKRPILSGVSTCYTFLF